METLLVVDHPRLEEKLILVPKGEGLIRKLVEC